MKISNKERVFRYLHTENHDRVPTMVYWHFLTNVLLRALEMVNNVSVKTKILDKQGIFWRYVFRNFSLPITRLDYLVQDGKYKY